MGKPIDDALIVAEAQMIETAAQKKQMEPLLNRQLKEVQRIDSSIIYYENKIAEAENEKKKELMKMNDLLELAGTSSHKLKNGYKVLPDNKHYIKIEDITLFLHWLKANKSPSEVIEFLEAAIGKTALKRFVNKEINKQRENGELTPSIAGIDFGEITYRRLTTKQGKKK